LYNRELQQNKNNLSFSNDKLVLGTQLCLAPNTKLMPKFKMLLTVL